MDVRLDGERVFDSEGLSVEVGPVKRDRVERSAAGLDGVLSVDLGSRTRRVKQCGVLRGQSKAKLREKIEVVSVFTDGKGHLLTVDGQQYSNVRVDSFEVTGERISGVGVETEYEVIYTQLQVQ